ncbi:MAG: hypothetical protein NDJ90_14530 [Oligoflexia bacterium]|nr:hypothetical protein [Oligoflexia bacterium]
MRMISAVLAVALAIVSGNAWAGRATGVQHDKVDLKDDVMPSPFKACKGVVVVSKSGYEKHKDEWKKWEKNCNKQVQVGVEAGVTKLDPLSDSMDYSQYFDFAQKVAENALVNLDKSKKYATCSKQCFSGADACDASLSDDGKPVSCAERREQTLYGLKVQARKIRMELALSTDDLKGTNVTVRNVMDFKPEQLINKGLKDFALGMENPVGRAPMIEREVSRAKTILEKEREALEAEYRESLARSKTKHSAELYRNWMSTKLMEKRESHQAEYLRLIYEKAPIFGVIDRPKSFDKGDEPVWDDATIAKAFGQLLENGEKTGKKIREDIKRGKLEFSRGTGEALRKWLWNAVPLTEEEHDLIYYISMAGQVEEVLAKDKSRCAIATTLAERLGGKQWQNMGAVMIASGFGMSAVSKKAAAGAVEGMAAVAGAKAVGLTGLAMTMPYLSESFKQYGDVKEQLASRSGVGGSLEGNAIRTKEDLDAADMNRKLNAVFALATPGIGAVTHSGVDSAKRFFANAALRHSLKGKKEALIAKGLAKADAEKLVRLATSTEEPVKKQALQMIDDIGAQAEKRLLGRVATQEEDELLEMMARKGGMGTFEEPTMDAVESYVRQIGQLADRDERRKAVKGAYELLQKFQPERVATPQQKVEATKALVAYSRLNVRDPDQLLKAATTYPEQSLQGMQKAAQQGAKILKDPKKAAAIRSEVQAEAKAAGVTDTKEIDALVASRAYKEGLSELRSGKPYSKLGVADKKIIDEMCVCPGMCRIAGSAASIESLSATELAALPACVRPVTRL